METYINGCYTKYGSRPLSPLEIKRKVQLPNGMWCVMGKIPEDGISVDVYRDKDLHDLVFMEHGYATNAPENIDEWTDDNFTLLAQCAESRCREMRI